MKNNLVEGIDYQFKKVENLPKNTCVELLTGKFKGVEFYYDMIKIPEEINEEADEVTINFNYEVVEYNNWNMEDLRENPEFEIYLGGILNNLLYKAVESFKNESGSD